MKKIFVFCIMLLTGCSTVYFDYSRYNGLVEKIKETGNKNYFKNKTVYVANDKDVPLYLQQAIYQGLSTYGMIPFNNRFAESPDYILTYSYIPNVYQGYRNVPIWGRSGINSIDTKINGYMAPGINYGSYNYAGYATSTVNYDYGIVGYQTIPTVTYDTVLWIRLYSNSSKEVYYAPVLEVNRNVGLYSMVQFLSAANSLATQQVSVETDLDCYVDDVQKRYICQEPRGVLGNLYQSVISIF